MRPSPRDRRRGATRTTTGLRRSVRLVGERAGDLRGARQRSSLRLIRPRRPVGGADVHRPGNWCLLLLDRRRRDQRPGPAGATARRRGDPGLRFRSVRRVPDHRALEPRPSRRLRAVRITTDRRQRRRRAAFPRRRRRVPRNVAARDQHRQQPAAPRRRGPVAERAAAVRPDLGRTAAAHAQRRHRRPPIPRRDRHQHRRRRSQRSRHPVRCRDRSRCNPRGHPVPRGGHAELADPRTLRFERNLVRYGRTRRHCSGHESGVLRSERRCRRKRRRHEQQDRELLVGRRRARRPGRLDHGDHSAGWQPGRRSLLRRGRNLQHPAERQHSGARNVLDQLGRADRRRPERDHDRRARHW